MARARAARNKFRSHSQLEKFIPSPLPPLSMNLLSMCNRYRPGCIETLKISSKNIVSKRGGGGLKDRATRCRTAHACATTKINNTTCFTVTWEIVSGRKYIQCVKIDRKEASMWINMKKKKKKEMEKRNRKKKKKKKIWMKMEWKRDERKRKLYFRRNAINSTRNCRRAKRQSAVKNCK